MGDRLKILFELYDSIVEKKEHKMSLIKTTEKGLPNSFDLRTLNEHILKPTRT